MAATTAIKQPFLTVFRPCSRAIGDHDPMSNFEKLFEKWKRRQDYQRKIDKNRSPDRFSKRKNEDRYQPFDFQNPPKVLQVKAIPLVPKPSSHSKSLPSIHQKQTVASMARR